MISLGSWSGSVGAGSSSSFSSFGLISFLGGGSDFFSLSKSSVGFAFFFSRIGGSGWFGDGSSAQARPEIRNPKSEARNPESGATPPDQ